MKKYFFMILLLSLMAKADGYDGSDDYNPNQGCGKGEVAVLRCRVSDKTYASVKETTSHARSIFDGAITVCKTAPSDMTSVRQTAPFVIRIKKTNPPNQAYYAWLKKDHPALGQSTFMGQDLTVFRNVYNDLEITRIYGGANSLYRGRFHTFQNSVNESTFESNVALDCQKVGNQFGAN